MKVRIAALAALTVLASAAAVRAQDEEGGPPNRGPPPMGAIQDGKYHTTLVRLGQQGEGLLYEPNTPSPKERIGIVFTHPSGNNFAAPIGREMASRGYRVLNVNYRGGENPGVDIQLPTLSLAVAYMKSLPGVQKVIVSGHSGGAHQMTLYENVAENGAAACNGPEKLFPCQTKGLDNLQKPDGLLVLDPPLGTFHEASGVDPAVDKDVSVRKAALDMWNPANGYDPVAKRGTYSAEFAKKFYAAQVAKNDKILAAVTERWKAIQAGKGRYANDEPFEVAGIGVDAGGTRLFQADPNFAAETKNPHLMLKADGTRDVEIIKSVRPPNVQSATRTKVLGGTSQSVTVQTYLGHTAIRLLPDYAVTKNDIVGVDWKSAYDSAPGNAYGIHKPTLIMAMGCHYLMVPAELIYDRLPATDKELVGVEGATHGFTACKPQYGDTAKRLFDYVDEWLSKPGRF